MRIWAKIVDDTKIIKSCEITVVNYDFHIFEEYVREIAEKLDAEFVCATGRKLVFYRRSSNPKVEHIIF